MFANDGHGDWAAAWVVGATGFSFDGEGLDYVAQLGDVFKDVGDAKGADDLNLKKVSCFSCGFDE